jgi:surface antigen
MLTKRLATLTFASLTALSLTACDYGTKETIGTLAGAGLGAWAGSAIDNNGSGGVIAVAAGTVIGGLLGSQIGKGLDKVDRQEAGQAQFSSLEYGRSGQSRQWYNPDTGNGGSVTPKAAYQNPRGQYCREYQQNITVGGKNETAYGTACRQSDGTWKVVN